MLLVFAIFLATVSLTQQQFLTPLMKTSPEVFPYHAYVEADLYCLGALISTRFVLVNAVCIESRDHATVHLGTTSDPYYQLFGSEGQVIKASELIPHPEFSKRYTDDLLVNNVGLVKLRDPALLTSKVQPISLPSRFNYPLLPGTFLNVTGYMDSIFTSDTLRFMTVKLRSLHQCFELYGKHLLKDHERCVEAHGKRIDWPGPFTMDGMLIGLARPLSRPVTCVVSESSCSKRDVFLSIEAYLDWIYDNSDVPQPVPLPPATNKIRPIKMQRSQFIPRYSKSPRIFMAPPAVILPEVHIYDVALK